VVGGGYGPEGLTSARNHLLLVLVLVLAIGFADLSEDENEHEDEDEGALECNLAPMKLRALA